MLEKEPRLFGVGQRPHHSGAIHCLTGCSLTRWERSAYERGVRVLLLKCVATRSARRDETGGPNPAFGPRQQRPLHPVVVDGGGELVGRHYRRPETGHQAGRRGSQDAPHPRARLRPPGWSQGARERCHRHSGDVGYLARRGRESHLLRLQRAARVEQPDRRRSPSVTDTLAPQVRGNLAHGPARHNPILCRRMLMRSSPESQPRDDRDVIRVTPYTARTPRGLCGSTQQRHPA